MAEFLLEANHITKRYATHTAVEDISLQIPKGSVFGMLGPNGAGKTTMIRIINQIIAPDEGTLLLDGEKLEPRHIEKIGYLPEERGLYKKMKVGEQALYLAMLKGLKPADAKQKLKVWFEKFEMMSWWNKKVEELSKGMQQKVQFVTTVIHEPSLLILDEPFTGFDPINAAIVKEELLRLKSTGVTIVISTHRMESVEELCDHIALIHKSKKVLGGAVKEIRKQYRTNTYELRLSTTGKDFTAGLPPYAEILDTKKEEEEDIYRIRFTGANSNELVQLACQSGLVHSFKEVLPSMNDIFIQTVQNN